MASRSWTERTALDPSPTAAATRFIEPWRTSPAANTPSVDVSNGSALAVSATERTGQLAVGEDEPIAVEQHTLAQPRRRRSRTDEAEQACARDLLLAAGRPVRERYPFEMIPAGERLNFDAGEEVDFRVGLDPLDQILRHALGEILACGWRS